MNVSQKCQYALRAVFELAKRWEQGPTKVASIAATQAIPAKFLESILGELKHGGFVDSRRGARGGYLLSITPGQLATGQIIRFIDGPLAPVSCMTSENVSCPLRGRCAFMSMWSRARDAISKVYDETTFQDLIEEQKVSSQEKYVASYCI